MILQEKASAALKEVEQRLAEIGAAIAKIRAEMLAPEEPELEEIRYVLEGSWSGYRESQRKVVQRNVISGARARSLDGLTTICFTDRTTLDLSVRTLGRGEVVTELNGYTGLIEEAEAKGLKGFIEIPF